MGLDRVRRGAKILKLKMNFIFKIVDFRRNRMLTLCVALLGLAVEASPAEAPFTLQGKVLDTTRAPIAAATVTAVPDAGGTPVSTHSDAQGQFRLDLRSGRYTIRIAAELFREEVYPLRARAEGGESREFVLKVAGVSETVTVTASPGYRVQAISSATRTLTPLRDVPQSVTVATRELIQDQLMTSVADVMRYVPGVGTHQGENNRDQVIIRGNSSSADFFLDGVRDDVQYYRDLYNLERVEALKGPNAMTFGRGGGGGVINRVTKEAGFQPVHEVSLQGGTYGRKRVAADVDQPLSGRLAFRLNGMYESSDSFRDQVDLSRYAVNPTLTFAASDRTKVTLGYEHLHDTRVADRGIPSFQGLPVDIDVATFFGNPDDSHVRASVDLGSALIEHRTGALTIRNRTFFGDYDRFYQNFVPGVVSADRSRVALSAYNNATGRRNVFNQTDVTYALATGPVRHTLLAGMEIGRQVTDNFRNTGFFEGAATSVSVPLAAPTIETPVSFRPGATDADNHLRTNVAATYVQDQMELSRKVQVLAGARFDRFDLRYHNNRNGDTLDRVDGLLSPRAGVVFKPAAPVSVYGSYGVSYLPSSGDQFSSLTTVTQQVEPEKFQNYEVGVKWDVRPELSLTSAAYRLDRTNTRSTDPNDPTRIVQTGSQRTNGFELGVSGRVTSAWRIAGGYSYQDAFVTRATAAARAGAQVAQVPHHTFSLWNTWQVVPRLGLGLGLLRRTDMFAAIDDTVVLPACTRVDAAAYFTLTRTMRLQANVENLLDQTYYANADNNTNISPGFRRALRVGLSAAF
jgi:catecholate siderophore receptor